MGTVECIQSAHVNTNLFSWWDLLSGGVCTALQTIM